MEKLMLLLTILLLSSCGDKSNDLMDSDFPVCIQEIIINPELSTDLKRIRTQAVNDEIHYWLNTEFIESDGEEFIVNSSCDTICSFCGFCLPAACTEDYDSEWTTIWER